jgi:hypothetical protein
MLCMLYNVVYGLLWTGRRVVASAEAAVTSWHTLALPDFLARSSASKRTQQRRCSRPAGNVRRHVLCWRPTALPVTRAPAGPPTSAPTRRAPAHALPRSVGRSDLTARLCRATAGAAGSGGAAPRLPQLGRGGRLRFRHGAHAHRPAGPRRPCARLPGGTRGRAAGRFRRRIRQLCGPAPPGTFKRPWRSPQ